MADTNTSDSSHIASDSDYADVSKCYISSNDSESLSPKKIFVKNLDKKLSESDIQSFFQKFGSVTYVRKPRRGKSIAFVTFAHNRDAFRALRASSEELILGKRQLAVEAAKTKRANQAREKATSQSQLDASASEITWWEVDETVPIHRLPNETLEHVFSFLTIKQRIQTELVCKKWRMIGKNVPWRSPAKLLLDPNREESALKRLPLNDSILSAVLSRCGRSLRQLTLTRGDRHTSLSGKSVKAIGKYCPNLVDVKLVTVPLTNQCLKMLAQGCGRLRRICLHNALDFGEEGLMAFLKRSELLECLEISKNFQIKGECLDAASKNLKSLRINDCPMVQTVALEKLMARCDSIHDLRLTHCYQLEADTLVKTFQHYSKTLKVVHMDGYSKSVSWGDGLSCLQHLEELSLRNCLGVTDEVLRGVAKKCTNLKSLNIRGTSVSDAGLADLTPAQHLTVLDISEASKVIGDGLEVLAAQGRLEEVYVRASTQLISPDSSCGCLARLCPNLRVLDVSGTISITNMLVEVFHDSIKEGFLKGTVKLVLGGTLVKKESVEKCERLELCFDNTSQHDLFLEIGDYYDSDDSYDDYSNVGYEFDYYDSSFDGDYADYDGDYGDYDYEDYNDYDDLAFFGADRLFFGEPY